MKVSRISEITLTILFLTAGICFSQSTSEAKFEQGHIEQVKKLVKELEYSDKVAEDFVQRWSLARRISKEDLFLSFGSRQSIEQGKIINKAEYLKSNLLR